MADPHVDRRCQQLHSGEFSDLMPVRAQCEVFPAKIVTLRKLVEMRTAVWDSNRNLIPKMLDQVSYDDKCAHEHVALG